MKGLLFFYLLDLTLVFFCLFCVKRVKILFLWGVIDVRL